MSISFRFLTTALAVFICLASLLFGGYIVLRVGQIEVEQEELAASFASEVAIILQSGDDAIARPVIERYVGTLTDRRLFDCFAVTYPDGEKLEWPVSDCSDSTDQVSLPPVVVAAPTDAGVVRIVGLQSESGPLAKLRSEEILVFLTIIVAGLVGFIATGFSYVRTIGRPLARLHDAVLVSEDPSQVRGGLGFGAFQDISNAYTELLRREGEVRRQEAFRRSVTESAFDCIVSADGSGCITEFNEAAERTFGFKRSEVLGCKLADTIIPEKYREMHNAGMARYLETGTGNVVGNRVEIEGLHAQGHIFPVELSLVAVEVDGETIFTAYLRDITERMEREAELEQLAEQEHLAQNRLLDAVNTLSDGFVFYDQDDRLVICNDRYKEIYFESADLFVAGASFEDIIRGGVARGQYLAAIGNEDAWIEERLARHRNPVEPMEQQLPSGRWVRVEERRTNDGGTVGLRVDISDLKQRTFELQEAKEEAEDANLAKSTFLATISHEIRSPLNAVLGALSLLGATRLEEEQQRYVDISRSSGEALLTVINDVLDMSKIEAGHIDLEYADFDLHALARESLDLFVLRVETKGLQFDLVLDSAVPRFVVGDAARIRQVLINLVSNAIKYTDHGGITVGVNLVEERSNRVLFSVTDTGSGIPEAQRENLFDPFTQVDDGFTRKHEGTGLGLAISKTLVELMQGQIGVDSSMGRGSEFWFELPLEMAENQPEAPMIDRPSSGAPQFRARGGRSSRVLLAEDSPSNQLVFRAYLEKSGIDVDVVGNGLEALEAVRRFPYDLVLMDISMPEMDGLEASTRINEEFGDEDAPPIIALTAHAMPGFRTTCLKAGMKDYLLKPVTMPRLIEMVGTWLDLEEVADEQDNGSGNGLIVSESLDDAVIAQLRETAGDKFSHLIATFLKEAKQRGERLAPALAGDDIKRLEREAHAIKGIAATYGAMDLSEKAAVLELAAAAGQLGKDEYREMIGTIRVALSETVLAYSKIT